MASAIIRNDKERVAEKVEGKRIFLRPSLPGVLKVMSPDLCHLLKVVEHDAATWPSEFHLT